MTEIDQRRRRRRLLLVVALLLTATGLAVLSALDKLDQERAGLIATFLSVIAAAAAWEATGRASDTAEEARRTADTVGRIERERWLAEQTPQFEFTLAPAGEGSTWSKFLVHLAGPDSLRHLDSVTIRIGDDDYDHTPRLAGPGPTPEQVAAHVWGPFRFVPHTDGADECGREVTFTDLHVGRGRPLSLDRTQPGFWMEGKTFASWQGQYAGHPLRLILTCRRGGDTWKVARNIDNPPLRPEATASAPS
ncbi:hypothetical protein [Streptomyces sp. NPDC056525]|uniref:hypothetical protein n=1 Tax=unclassified Streptomyces TaxID=2593676 RepID=UPI00367D2216